jgi:hypothetical protein
MALGLFEREKDQTFVPTKQLREVEIERALWRGAAHRNCWSRCRSLDWGIALAQGQKPESASS